MAEEQRYDEWIAKRRAVEPSRELTDRVMASVEGRDMQRNRYLSVVDRMNESRPARWAACVAASLVGGLPLLVVAHLAKMLAF